MPTNQRTAFTIIFAHDKETDPADIATAVAFFFGHATDVEGDLDGVQPCVLIGTPTPHDARLVHEQAIQNGLDLFTDHMAPAIVAYFEEHGELPQHANDVEGYGDDTFDPCQVVNEHYELDTCDMLLEECAAILDHSVMGELAPGVDRGTVDRDDPVQGVKDLTAGVFSQTVHNVCGECFEALRQRLAGVGQLDRATVSEAITAARDEVEERYS